MTQLIERRFSTAPLAIDRENISQGDGRTVRGYAALFGKRSETLATGGVHYFEVIERGAFDAVLKDDVRCLFNHDPNLILARCSGGKGSLRFGVDASGLWYSFEAPDTQIGRDLLVSLRRGDINQSSFAFIVAKDGQKFTSENGTSIRTITKVGQLLDVSPVAYPAYVDTTVCVGKNSHAPETPMAQSFPFRSYWAARFGVKQ